MVEVIRLANAVLNTKDVEQMIAYYTEILGMNLVERGDEGNAYLNHSTDHHNLVLAPSNESGLRTLSYQVDSQYSMKEVVNSFIKEGIKAELKTDAQPGIPELVELTDPDGNLIHIFSESKSVSTGFPNIGIVPHKLGHIALQVKDAKKAVSFYEKYLGFKVSDWMADFFCFMRCNQDHHSMNFLQSKNSGKMHHIAFELKDWSHIQASTDFLSKNKKPLIWGPVRHGIGHNISTYHYDSEGNIVEFYAELDVMNEKLGYFEPRPWHQEFPQKPKTWESVPDAANLWGIMPPDEFME